MREKTKVKYYNWKKEATNNQEDPFNLIASISESSSVQPLPQALGSRTLAHRCAEYVMLKIYNIICTSAIERAQ